MPADRLCDASIQGHIDSSMGAVDGVLTERGYRWLAEKIVNVTTHRTADLIP